MAGRAIAVVERGGVGQQQQTRAQAVDAPGSEHADAVWSGVAALLGGTEDRARRVESLTVREILHATGIADADHSIAL